MATTRIIPFAFAACCGLLASPAGAQPQWSDGPRLLHARMGTYGQSRGPDQTDTFSRSFRVGPAGTLDLQNFSGDVTVTGGSGEEIAIRAVKRVRSRDAGEARRQLDEVVIQAAEHAGRVEVRTVLPRTSGDRGGRHSRVDVDFTVDVPAGTSVYLKSFSGSIRVTNVKGEIRQETMSGDLQATNVGNLVRLKTMSGDIDLNTTAADGEIVLSTVSGTAMLRRVKARTLDASTVSGDLRLEDALCATASLRSVNGDIEFAGDFMKNGRYEFKSHAGDVSLALGAATGFEIDAETFSGETRSALSLARGAGEQAAAEGRGRAFGSRLRGTFGDGSAVVQVKTFAGDVTIVKK